MGAYGNDVEMDYGDDAPDYQIAGQRVVTDWGDEDGLQAGAPVGGYGKGGGYGDEGAGAYDEQELVNNYPQ